MRGPETSIDALVKQAQSRADDLFDYIRVNRAELDNAVANAIPDPQNAGVLWDKIRAFILESWYDYADPGTRDAIMWTPLVLVMESKQHYHDTSYLPSLTSKGQTIGDFSGNRLDSN